MIPPWNATVDGVVVSAEPASSDRHGALVHAWMNAPHVAPWWQLDRPIDQVRAYLDGLTHLQPWIVSADGVPFAYVETYRVVDDPLARYYPAEPSDLGWHVLVGPERFLGSGVPRLMGRVLRDALLDHGERAVCEPDVRNARMLAFCRRLGYRSLGEVDLPDKRAAIMACSRADREAAA